ncbi:MAG: hypothetical protein DRJ09_04895, partial [Bacteroidetes bacterium]
YILLSPFQYLATLCFCRERERELANLPRTLATDTLPKFFNDFTQVAHLIIIGATIFYLIILRKIFLFDEKMPCQFQCFLKQKHYLAKVALDKISLLLL